MFEEFTQQSANPPTPWSGSGLGLSIAREIVLRLGGQLFLHSAPGQGSQFFFWLPYPVTAQAPENEAAAPQPHAFPARVWIVDDYAYNALVTGEMLKKHFPAGSFQTFETAEAFLEALSLSATLLPHLVLLDLNLPKASGTVAMQVVRERFSKAELPLVAHTASLLAGNNDSLLADGFNALLLKPYPESELIRVVVSFLPEAAPVSGSTDQPSPTFESLFLQLVPKRLEAVTQALAQKDWKTVQATVHLMRPQLLDAGMEADAALFESFEYFDPAAADEMWEALTALFISQVQAKLASYSPTAP